MFSSPLIRAETAETLLQRYAEEARKSSPGFQGFSANRGHELYFKKGSGSKSETSCSTCHSQDPRRMGRTRANKDIQPLAPSAYPMRFTDAAKVEKWFGRNCDDVFSRPCTALEKGDFITWLLTIK
jgi:cytochrome c peroxidase